MNKSMPLEHSPLLDHTQSNFSVDQANKLVVYTTLFGEYDELIPAPGHFEDVRFVCFSDRPLPESKGWEIILVRRKLDPARETRYYKILSGKVLPQCQQTLWIDANLGLWHNPQKLVSKILAAEPGAEISISQHARRDCVYAEGQAVVVQRRAGAKAVADYLDTLLARDYPRRAGLWQCSLIYRRATTAVQEFERIWWHEFMSGPPRDQLSVGLALKLSGAAMYTLPTREYSYLTFRSEHRRWWNSLFNRIPLDSIQGVEAGRGVGEMAEKLVAEHSRLSMHVAGESAESPPAPRIEFIKGTCVEAASFFADSQLDFVLLGGLNTYSEVLAHLQAWKPKIRPGGWLCGHGYQCERNTSSGELTKAVDSFAKQIGGSVESGAEHTWFIQIAHATKANDLIEEAVMTEAAKNLGSSDTSRLTTRGLSLLESCDNAMKDTSHCQ